MSPQDKDKYQILAALHSLPDAALITKSDLATLLSMSCRGIEKLMRESAAPPRYNMPNRLLRFQMADVKKWMQDRQNHSGTVA
jgi:predicted DNA-binding transcriptional regulator AlpA